MASKDSGCLYSTTNSSVAITPVANPPQGFMFR